MKFSRGRLAKMLGFMFNKAISWNEHLFRLVVSSPESLISFERQCLDQYTSFLYTLSLFIATKVPDFSVEWDILQNDLRFAPKKPKE